jgi:hypothetical protein
MTTRSKLIIIALVLTTLNIGIAPSFAAPTLKGKCTKLNTYTQIGNKTAICSKSGSKLIWTLATSAQIKVYQKQQSQQKLVTDRKKTIADLIGTKETYSDLTSKITTLNTVLIDTKRLMIQTSRDLLIDLQKQMAAQQQTKVTYEANLQTAIKNIGIEQPLVNYYQNEMNIQQAVVNNAKTYYDAYSFTYLSAKAEAESLAYAYENAVNSNTTLMMEKVLCDFGFRTCGTFNTALFDFNASIIRQYNAATAKASAAAAPYTNYYNEYTAALRKMNEFKSMHKKYNDSLVWFTAQKNQIDSVLTDTNSKITNLDLLINQETARLVILESAEKRISQDVQKHSEISTFLGSRSADLVAAIDSFLNIADVNFISTTSAANWNSKYLDILNIQKDIDTSLIEIKELAISLENFLSTL